MSNLIAISIFANIIGFAITIAILVWCYIQWHAFLDTQKSISNSLERLSDYKRIELSKSQRSDRID